MPFSRDARLEIAHLAEQLYNDEDAETTRKVKSAIRHDGKTEGGGGGGTTTIIEPGAISDHSELTGIGTNTHAQIDSHIASTANPHAVTAAQVGLGSVNNTADVDKPVSTAQQTALNLKQDVATIAELIRDTIAAALTAGANVTITPNDAGDTITIAATGGGSALDVQELGVSQNAATTAIDFETGLNVYGVSGGLVRIEVVQATIEEWARDAIGAALTPGTGLTVTPNDAGNTIALALDADLATIAGLTPTTDNVIQSVAGSWASRTVAQLKATLALVKGDVGLGNVDNTADTAKPVSTAQQTALDLKQDKSWVKGQRFTPATTFTSSTAANMTSTGGVSNMAFAVNAGEIWQFEFVIFVGVNNTGGVRFTFTCPTGYGLQAEAIGDLSSLTTVNHQRMDTAGTLTTAFHTFNAQTGVVRIVGTLTNTGGGTLQLQVAAGTNGQTVTINAGSYFLAHRLA